MEAVYDQISGICKTPYYSEATCPPGITPVTRRRNLAVLTPSFPIRGDQGCVVEFRALSRITRRLEINVCINSFVQMNCYLLPIFIAEVFDGVNLSWATCPIRNNH